MLPQGPNEDWIRYIGLVLLSAIGGVLGHMMRTLDSGERVRLGRTLLEGTSAAFVGVMILLACEANGVDGLYTGVIVALSGWAGAGASIQLMDTFVRRKFGLPVAQTSKDETHEDPNDEKPSDR